MPENLHCIPPVLEIEKRKKNTFTHHHKLERYSSSFTKPKTK